MYTPGAASVVKIHRRELMRETVIRRWNAVDFMPTSLHSPSNGLYSSATSRLFARPCLLSSFSPSFSSPSLSPLPPSSPWLPRSSSVCTAMPRDPNEFDRDGAGLDDGDTREEIMLSEFILR